MKAPIEHTTQIIQLHCDELLDVLAEMHVDQLLHSNPLKTNNMSETLGKNDKWTFYQDAANQWRWKRQAPNNEVVGASTEGYINKKDCLDNAVRHGYVLPANQIS